MYALAMFVVVVLGGGGVCVCVCVCVRTCACIDTYVCALCLHACIHVWVLTIIFTCITQYFSDNRCGTTVF